MINVSSELFVLDVVTSLLIMFLFVQFYYIHRLQARLSQQDKTLAQLKEMLTTIFEATKDGNITEVVHHKAN